MCFEVKELSHAIIKLRMDLKHKTQMLNRVDKWRFEINYELKKAKHENEMRGKQLVSKDKKLDEQEHEIHELKQEVFASDVTIKKLTRVDFLREEIESIKEEFAKNKAENIALIAQKDEKFKAEIAQKDEELK